MTRVTFRFMTGVLLVLCMSSATFAGEKAKEGVFPGTMTRNKRSGVVTYRDGKGNKANFIKVPAKPAKGKPWVWRARFPGVADEFDGAMLKRGYHIVYCDVKDLYGSPKAVERWNKHYEWLTTEHGFSKKPILEGMSRGGLIIYNWAIANPDKVGAIYGDAPVMDLKSWPGNFRKVKDAGYPFKSVEEFRKYKGNPIDNLKVLADAKIPIIHVVGDKDTTVPVSENTAIAEKRYKEMGGIFEVIHKPDVGHHPHGCNGEDRKKLIEFMEKHAKK